MEKANSESKLYLIKEITVRESRDFLLKYHSTGNNGKQNPVRCFGLFIDDCLYGTSTWGYNLSSGKSAQLLFGSHSKQCDYYDNLRLLVLNNTVMYASSFLSKCVKLLFAENKKLKYVLAYADGLHGFKGIIYQASNFLYIGKSKLQCWYLEDYGLISSRALQDYFGTMAIPYVTKIYPQIKMIYAQKFRYIRFRQKDKLMQYAQFKVLPYSEIPKVPKIVDHEGRIYNPEFFKHVAFRGASKLMH